MNIFSDSSTTAQTVVQGSTSAFLLAYYHTAIIMMLPFIFAAVALIIADLVFGIKAAKARGEEVRFSRAVRRTINKLAEYLCWIMLAVTLSLSFEAQVPNLKYYIVGVVMIIESRSIVDNYLESKGKKLRIDWQALLGKLFKTAGAGIEITDRNDDNK